MIHDDFGEARDLDHGLVHGEIARERWTIQPDDPLSAHGETHWTQSYARDDWSVRTETFTAMTSTADTFRLTARIEAYEGDKLVFERDFDEAIPRTLV